MDVLSIPVASLELAVNNASNHGNRSGTTRNSFAASLLAPEPLSFK